MNDANGDMDFEHVLFPRYPGINLLDSLKNGYVRYRRTTSPSEKIFLGNSYFDTYGIDRLILLVTGIMPFRKGRLLILYPYTNHRSLPLMVLQVLYSLRENLERKMMVLFTRWANSFLEEYKRLVLSGSGSPFYQHIFPLLDVKDEQKGENGRSMPTLMISRSPYLRPSSTQTVACIMVDLDRSVFQTKDEYSDFLKWISDSAVETAIFVSSNPFGEIEQTLATDGVQIFGWGRSGIGREPVAGSALSQEIFNPFSIPFAEWNILRSNPHWIFLKIQDIPLEDSLEKVFEGITEITRFYRSDQSFEKLLQKTKKAVYTMLSVPAPLSYFEEFYGSQFLKTIREHLENLDYEISELSEREETVGGKLKAVSMGIHEMYKMLSSKENSKGKAVLKVLNEAQERGKNIALVARDGGYIRALTDYLADSGYDEEILSRLGIEITTPKNLSASLLRSASVFTFCPPWFEAKTIFQPASRNVGFLCFKPEYYRLKRLLRNEENIVERALSPSARSKFLSSLLFAGPTATQRACLASYAMDRGRPSLEEEICVLKVGSKVRQWQETSLLEDSLFETGPNHTIQDPEEDEDEAEELDSQDDIRDIGPEEEVAAYKVTFSDGTSLQAYEESIVQIINIDGEGFVAKRVKNLKENDVVALVNRGIRSTIIDALIRKADKDQRMKSTVSLRRKWIEALRTGMQANKDTPKTLLAKLKRRGSEIENPMTIYLWSRDIVIGPRNKLNIKLVGEIYKDELLVSRFREINDAIEKLRHIHRVLAQRLRRVSREVAVARDTYPYDREDKNDPDLELLLRDLEKVIKLATVRSIEGPLMVKMKQLSEVVNGMS